MTRASTKGRSCYGLGAHARTEPPRARRAGRNARRAPRCALSRRAICPTSSGSTKRCSARAARAISPQRWRWSQEENGFPAETMRWSLLDGTRLVGFLATVPQRFRVAGHEVLVHSSCDFMVHPDYRFHGIALMREYFRACDNCVSLDDMPATIAVLKMMKAVPIDNAVRYVRVLDGRVAKERVPRLSRVPELAFVPATWALAAYDRGGASGCRASRKRANSTCGSTVFSRRRSRRGRSRWCAIRRTSRGATDLCRPIGRAPSASSPTPKGARWLRRLRHGPESRPIAAATSSSCTFDQVRRLNFQRAPYISPAAASGAKADGWRGCTGSEAPPACRELLARQPLRAAGASTCPARQVPRSCPPSGSRRGVALGLWIRRRRSEPQRGDVTVRGRDRSTMTRAAVGRQLKCRLQSLPPGR